MKPTDDILIRLKKYAKGELGDQERTDMELLLKEQPGLQEELAFTRAMIRATEKLERQRLWDVLETEDLPGAAETPPAPRGIFATISRPAWAMAATLALLLTVTGIWWFNYNTDPLRPYQNGVYAYIDPPPADGGALRGTSGEAPLRQAYGAYEAGKFRESLSVLEGVSRQDSAFTSALLLQGHNYYRLGEYQQAVRALDTLRTLLDQPAYFPVSADNAGWTRIRALLAEYLASEHPDKRSALLREINAFLAAANPGDSYYKNAEALKVLLEKR